MTETLFSLFQRSVCQWPERPAMWLKGELYSYQALWDQAIQLAVIIQQLSRSGVPIGTHLAIYAHKSLPAYVGVVTSLLTGLNYLPLNPRFPAERNWKMMDTTQSVVWIVDERCMDDAKELLAQCTESVAVFLPDAAHLPSWVNDFPKHQFFSQNEINQSNSQNWEAPSLSAEDGAYTLFTSGSTGMPKGVLVTHGNVTNYLENIYKLIHVEPTDRCTQLFDLTFDLSVHDMFVCWRGGACLYVVPENAGLFANRFVQEHNLTHWFSVPSTAVFIKQMNMLEPDIFPSLKYALFCGEALHYSLARAFQSAAPNALLLNLYGPTEATIAFTSYHWTSEDQASDQDGVVPIGIPLESQQVAITNESLVLAADGEMGELLLGGTQVTPGYYKNPLLTAERFVTLAAAGKDNIRFYRTGDLVSWDPVLGLKFHGRVDRQVKIRGFRVELQEIENVLRRIVELEHVAVIGVPANSKDGFKSVVAYIASPTATASSAKIIEIARDKLPDYMVPEAIYWLQAFPLNANGKIDYKALSAQHESRAGQKVEI